MSIVEHLYETYVSQKTEIATEMNCIPIFSVFKLQCKYTLMQIRSRFAINPLIHVSLT